LATATVKIADASSGFKLSALSGLDTVNASIGGQFSTIQTNFTTMLDGLNKTAFGYLDMGVSYVASTSLYRVLFLAVYGLPVLVSLLGVGFKSPRLMKGCNCLCVPYYLLLHILAVVFLIMAFVIGDGTFTNVVCNVAFDIRPISPSLSTGSLSMMSTGLTALDSCYANSSLLEVASNLNLIDGTQVNFSSIASKQINSLNFSSVGSFDIRYSILTSSAISLSDSPTNQISALTSVNLGSIDTKSIDSLSVTLIPSLKANLTTLNSSLANLYELTKTNSNIPVLFILSFTPLVNTTLDALVVSDFQRRLSVIFTIINGLVNSGGTLDQMSTSSIGLSGSLVTVNSTAKTLISTANTLPGYYNQSIAALLQFASDASSNITVVVPRIISKILGDIDTQSVYIGDQFKCQEVATQVYSVRDGVCGKLMYTSLT
jgi:hypothetical protein